MASGAATGSATRQPRSVALLGVSCLVRSQPSGIPGRLGLAAMGRSSDFLNVMWLARCRGDETPFGSRCEECERPEGLLKRMNPSSAVH